MDKDLINKLIKWGRRKHPKRSAQWVFQRYPHKTNWQGRNKNRFGYFEKGILKYVHSFAEKSIVRHFKISGGASPYNGDWIYWVFYGGEVYSTVDYHSRRPF